LLEGPIEAVGERVERTRLIVEDFAPELEDAGFAVCCHAGALAQPILRCEALDAD
jgi:hypothetical protein